MTTHYPELPITDFRDRRRKARKATGKPRRGLGSLGRNPLLQLLSSDRKGHYPMGDRRAEQVAALHRHFVARAQKGHALTISGVCAENPEFAEDLREFHEERVEDLMVEFLADHTLEDEEAFEAFCRRSPAYEEELRKLPQRMRALGAALETNHSASQPQSALFEQPEFARYQVLGSRGRGAMGEVFRVWDGELRRELALKVMHPADHLTPDHRERAHARFIEEAQVTSQLDHPGIVPVHELGATAQGTHYFTMKLVKGRSLETVLNSRASGEAGWTTMRSVRVTLKVAEALAYAHYKGVLHRDLKPANIMVGRYGSVYVMDWGLARVDGSLDTHIERTGGGAATRAVESIRSRPMEGQPSELLGTEPGGKVGTPYYMAPEQAAGRGTDLDAAADVYGLGATLYHMLAGEPPYKDTHGNRPLEDLLQHLQRKGPTPLAQLQPGLPPALVELVERAMARNPAKRFANMEALASALRELTEAPAPASQGDAGASPRSEETWASFAARNWPFFVLLSGGPFVLGLWMQHLLE